MWPVTDFQGWIMDLLWPKLNTAMDRDLGDYSTDVDFDSTIYLCERDSKSNRNESAFYCMYIYHIHLYKYICCIYKHVFAYIYILPAF
jgi:hypothetical protein